MPKGSWLKSPCRVRVHVLTWMIILPTGLWPAAKTKQPALMKLREGLPIRPVQVGPSPHKFKPKIQTTSKIRSREENILWAWEEMYRNAATSSHVYLGFNGSVMQPSMTCNPCKQWMLCYAKIWHRFEDSLQLRRPAQDNVVSVNLLGQWVKSGGIYNKSRTNPWIIGFLWFVCQISRSGEVPWWCWHEVDAEEQADRCQRLFSNRGLNLPESV